MQTLPRYIPLLIAAVLAVSSPAHAVEIGTPSRITVFPPTVKIDGSRRTMHLIVDGHTTDGRVQDLTRTAKYTSGDPQVAAVVDGVVRPRGDGKTEIVVEVGGNTRRVPVEVANFAEATPVSFNYDVLVALSKHSCSSGACHGTPTGKGGFRLSLRGFDPALDRMTLIREEQGRRTNPFNPEESLLLLKPTMRVAHGGGLQMRERDEAYKLLRDWIGAGSRVDEPDAAVCEKIEVYPKDRTYQWPAHTQQLCVLAHFSDGSARDVTNLAVYSSSDEKVAEVDEHGHVESIDRGDATVVIRYLDHIDTTALTFLRDVPEFRWTNPIENNDVDKLVFAKLQQLQIAPSELCSDGEFIRRLFLDVLGVLPTPQETTAFLADGSADKRTKLIDDVLQRPGYAEFWALKWADLLRVKSSKVGAAGVYKYHRWIVDSVRDNVPYDHFARQLLTSQGSTFANPPANYFNASTDTNDTAETTSQLFLGIRIQCARCHNHPFDRWSQDNYYGIGAFFNRVQRMTTNLPGERVIWVARDGEVTQPRTGLRVKPYLPLKGEVEDDGEQDRREVFARWLTSVDNPFFARVGVNRIWGHLMGRGIVEPVDDFSISNPPSNPALLDALADEFIRSGFDSKRLLRSILNSRTYQLSSSTNRFNVNDAKYFSHANARLLSAEQLLDAISRVTESPENFIGVPAKTRAGQLPSPEMGNDFLKVFGQPGRNSACECERSDDPKLSYALQMINGQLISQKLKHRRGRLARLLDDQDSRLAAAGKPPEKGLALWLKVDAGVLGGNQSPANDGQAVATWQDQSSHARHVSQANDQHRPTFVAKSSGGLPALRFDGKDDFLHNTVDNLIASGAARTVLVVGQAAQAKGGALFAFRRGRPVFTVQHITIGSQYYVYSDGVNGAGNSTLPFDRRKALLEPFLTTFTSPGAGKKLSVRVNGVIQPVAQSGAVGEDGGTAGFTIGNREDLPLGQQLWHGDISEVLVYDRVLLADELQAAGSYLTTKYGLSTTYPTRPLPPQVAKSKGKTDRQIIGEFYLAALSRHPSEGELAVAQRHIVTVSDRRSGLEDLCWALLNSKEFLFQH